MKLQVVSVRDSKTETFNQPFFARTIGEAERSFSELTKDPKSFVSKYPEDYDLYKVGEYDDQTGLLTALDTPQHVSKAINFARTN